MTKFTDKFMHYFRHFGGLNGVVFIARGFLKKHFLPHGRISYAQSGEDMVLQNYFSSSPRGFYIDVGCNHPINNSNTYLLYQQGWSGICIDANDALIALYARFRPKDSAICCAVSNKSEPVNFTFFQDSLLSSAQQEHVDNWKKTHPVKTEALLNAKSLNEILKNINVPEKIDLLSIDVESFDWQVLQSIDLNQYHPRMILIELHNYKVETVSQSPIYKHLISYGYRLAAYCVENAYFVDSSIEQ